MLARWRLSPAVAACTVCTVAAHDGSDTATAATPHSAGRPVAHRKTLFRVDSPSQATATPKAPNAASVAASIDTLQPPQTYNHDHGTQSEKQYSSRFQQRNCNGR